MNTPKMTVVYSKEEKSFQFTQETQPEEDGFAFI